MKALRTKMIEEMKLRNFSPRTQKSYVAAMVLDYLGRYTHRVALSNDRIVKVQNGEVTLSYRDRKDGS